MASIPNIEPVNPRFFETVSNDPLISATAKESLVNRALEGRIALEGVRAQMVQQRQTEKLNDIRIRAGEFELGEAMRKARQERDDVQAAGAMAGRYEDVLSDDTLTPDEKHDELDSMVVKNPGVFSRSKSLQHQYGAAKGMLPARVTEAQKRAIAREDRIEMQWEASRKDAAEKQARRDEIAALEGEVETVDNLWKEVMNIEFAGGGLADLAKTDDDYEAPSKFKNPNDRHSVIGLIQLLSQRLNVPQPAAYPSNDLELQRMAADLRARYLPALAAHRSRIKVDAARNPELDKLLPKPE